MGEGSAGRAMTTATRPGNSQRALWPGNRVGGEKSERAYVTTQPIALHPPSAHSVVPVTNEESSSLAR
jgi:hypothetical protein